MVEPETDRKTAICITAGGCCAVHSFDVTKQRSADCLAIPDQVNMQLTKLDALLDLLWNATEVGRPPDDCSRRLQSYPVRPVMSSGVIILYDRINKLLTVWQTARPEL
jgi:hypothetical protein